MSELQRTSAPIHHRVRGEVAGYFVSMHAITPEEAVDYRPQSASDRRRFEKMLGQGVLRQEAPGRYWIDLSRYHVAAEHQSKQAVMVSLIVALLGAAVAVLFYRG